MAKSYIAAALLMLGTQTLVHGQNAPPTSQGTPLPVATVLDKKISLNDLRPSKEEAALLDADLAKLSVKAAEKQRRELREEMLRGFVLSVLAERYAKDHHLDADETEIKSFLQFMESAAEKTTAIIRGRTEEIRRRLADKKVDDAERKSLTAELASLEAGPEKDGPPPEAERRAMRAESERLRTELKSDGLNDAERKALRDNIAMNERFQDLTDEQAAVEWKKVHEELMRSMAVGSVQDWKLKRELFKRYGGGIIWQQSGLEPIDAERAFLQEREKVGDFTIYDADLKEGFWRYWKQDQGPFRLEKITGREFDTPWWLQAPPDCAR